MGREVETKESTLDRFAKMTQIGSQIAGTLQNVQRIGQAQQALSQDQERIKLAQDHAKMQQEEWGFRKEQLAEEYKQKRLETRTKAGDQLNNEIFNVLDNSAASADPKAYVDSWVSNPDNINRLAKVAQIGELPFQESDVNLLKKNMLVAAPFLKGAKSAEAKFQQALTAPDAAFDTEAAQKALAEYNAAFNGTSGILPRAISKVMQDRQDAFTKEIDAKNKRIEDSRQKGLDRASKEREAVAKAGQGSDHTTIMTEREAVRQYNSATKPLEEKVSSARSLATMSDLALTNAIAKGSIGFTAAITAGSNSQLSDAERETFTKAGGVLDKAKQSFQNMADGTLIPGMAKQYKAWAAVMEQRHKNDLSRIGKQFTSQYVDSGLIAPEKGSKIFVSRDAAEGQAPDEQKKVPPAGSPRNRFLID